MPMRLPPAPVGVVNMTHATILLLRVRVPVGVALEGAESQVVGFPAVDRIRQLLDLSASARVAVGQAACGALQSTAVMLYGSNQAASTFATISANTIVQSGTTAVGTWGGTCAAPTFTNTAGGQVTNCTPINAPFC